MSISVAHHACQTLELLRCETLELSATDMWPPKGPDLSPIEGLHERTKRTSQYISFFLPITQWCSISDVLFTGERGVSHFSVLKYY